MTTNDTKATDSAVSSFAQSLRGPRGFRDSHFDVEGMAREAFATGLVRETPALINGKPGICYDTPTLAEISMLAAKHRRKGA